MPKLGWFSEARVAGPRQIIVLPSVTNTCLYIDVFKYKNIFRYIYIEISISGRRE
jgi:hypothetical protein